jgi:hypothetical protein
MADEKVLDIARLYKPLPQQMKFHRSGAKFRLYGGSAGGGKTIALIWEGILRCLKYDFPVTGAIFRRSFPELDSTIIRTTLESLPDWFYKYNQQQHVLTLKTGDRIEYGYAETDNDVLRYMSREWDWLAIDELTHFTEYRFTYLMSRVRTTKALKTKFFAATNPGGIGHMWVKKRWVDKSCDDSGYDPSEYEFFPAKVTDNTYLMNANPEYVNNLKMLPENERKALLYGDWEIFKGQFFNEWDGSKHIVKAFDIPENWRLVLGWDDGDREPRSVHLYAVDNDRGVWAIWEYYRKGEAVINAARNIKDELMKAGYWSKIYKLVVDPSMGAKNAQTGISSKEVLEGIGYGFKVGEVELGNNAREEGWRLVKSYLTHKPYEEPLLKVFATCENMIRTIPQLIYHESKTGDSKKEDLNTSQEDHAADELRYVLMSLGEMPDRFQSSKKFKIETRDYVPKSILNN